MKMQRMWILSAGMTFLAGISLGQGAHPAPTFEVASIKPAPPFSLEKMMSGQVHVGKISGSRVDFGFVSLLDLLAYAYRVKPYQISGPAWMTMAAGILMRSYRKASRRTASPKW